MVHDVRDEGETSFCTGNDADARVPSVSPRTRVETSDHQLPPSKPLQVRWRDLPHKDQLFILALCRLSEPLSNVCLLPYIFYLVRSVLPTTSNPSSTPDADAGANTARISEYSGLLVAAFPLAQCLVSLPWGRLSDRHGRRPSILAGLLVSVLANVGFGLSRSLASLLFWRVLAGLANGNVSIMRTVTAEAVQDRRYQARAFLLLPLVFNSGMVASLALGGALAEPAVSLPRLFGPDGVFNTSRNPGGVAWALAYPYALPALLNAAILSCSLLLGLLGLRETLPGREGQTDWGLQVGAGIARWAKRLGRRRQQYEYVALESSGSETTVQGDDDDDDEKRLNTTIPSSQPPSPPQPGIPFRQIWTRKVLCALVSFGLLPLHNSAFMHIFPIYLSTPSDTTANSDNYATFPFFAFTGGLGLRAPAIGLWLAVFGVFGILLQLLAFPYLQSRLGGTRGVLRVALLLFPLTYLLAPYLSLLATNINNTTVDGDEYSEDSKSDGHAAAGLWACLALVICAQITARTMAIPSTVILLTEASPDRRVLGTVHGAGNMLASLARAVGPAVGGWVFAVGVEVGVIGLVWWVYLVSIALSALAWSHLMEGDDR
ncbi:MFS general substrate transporter [Xylariaceae sp. FL0016]|nr:MFS general substrate transporter [Xylariaceae sp. FL0016]